MPITKSSSTPTYRQVSHREEIIMLAISSKELTTADIIQAIDDASGGARKVENPQTMHPVLRSLQRKGIIEFREENRGSVRFRYHKLTAHGTDVLNEIQAFRSRLVSWGK